MLRFTSWIKKPSSISDIKRETLKVANGGPWWQPVLPVFSYFLIPWMGVAFFSYLSFFRNRLQSGLLSPLSQNENERRLVRLAIAGMLPTLGFFAYFPYRSEIYAMPVIGMMACLILYFLKNTETPALLAARKWTLSILGVFVLIIPVIFTLLDHRFQMSANGWPIWFIPLIWVFALSSVVLQLWDQIFSEKTEKGQKLGNKQKDGLGIFSTLSKVSFLTTLTLILSVLGEMETAPLKARIEQDKKKRRKLQVTYWNTNRLIWNEWGLMRLAIREPITPLLTEKEVLQAIQRGDLILAERHRSWKRDPGPSGKALSFPRGSNLSLESLENSWSGC